MIPICLRSKYKVWPETKNEIINITTLFPLQQETAATNSERRAIKL